MNSTSQLPSMGHISNRNRLGWEPYKPCTRKPHRSGVFSLGGSLLELADPLAYVADLALRLELQVRDVVAECRDLILEFSIRAVCRSRRVSTPVNRFGTASNCSATASNPRLMSRASDSLGASFLPFISLHPTMRLLAREAATARRSGSVLVGLEELRSQEVDDRSVRVP